MTAPTSSDAPRPKRSIAEMLDAIDRQTHAGVALVVAAAIDRLLEDGLETRLTVPNRDFRDKLFGDFGVLGGFSAKIDLSLALGVLDQDSYVHATGLRKIRNLFAHSYGDFLHFSMPNIQALLPRPTVPLPLSQPPRDS